MKRYIPIKTENNSENYLRVMMDYSLGGHNWYNGDNERRGYYLYCSPVEKKTSYFSNGEPFVTYTETVGKGGKFLLKEVSRQSKKANEEAVKLAKGRTEEIVALICKKYEFELVDFVELCTFPDNDKDYCKLFSVNKNWLIENLKVITGASDLVAYIEEYNWDTTYSIYCTALAENQLIFEKEEP